MATYNVTSVPSRVITAISTSPPAVGSPGTAVFLTKPRNATHEKFARPKKQLARRWRRRTLKSIPPSSRSNSPTKSSKMRPNAQLPRSLKGAASLGPGTYPYMFPHGCQ